MSELKLDQAFWDERYITGDMGWDIGYPSTPIKEYIDQLADKNIKILIPGCGNAYEAEYLHQKGFKNTYLLDISPLALENFKKRVPDFPEDHLIQANFFEHQGQYDLILEQTFFCALAPQFRADYAQHMKELLKPGGKLTGLLFDAPLNIDKPPFGGNAQEYRTYFEQLFAIFKMESCYNSIAPRAGRELFVILRNDK